MMETFTSINKLNYLQPTQENQVPDAVVELDTAFYDHIRPQLDQLLKSPSDDSIQKILAYSRAK